MPLWPSNPKLLGEQAECAFLYQAIKRGWVVSKPYGDSAPYDFIIDSGPYHDKPSRVLRVQVRSAVSECRGWYTVRAGHGGQCLPFTYAQADFLVAFIPPHDAWYVIPVSALVGVRRGIAFRPHVPTKSRWEQYREAWVLLGEFTSGSASAAIAP
jgi:PD-(D/E)XK endonuclease